MRLKVTRFLLALPLLIAGTLHATDSVLIEAESFTDHGGWQLDTQFIRTMG